MVPMGESLVLAVGDRPKTIRRRGKVDFHHDLPVLATTILFVAIVLPLGHSSPWVWVQSFLECLLGLLVLLLVTLTAQRFAVYVFRLRPTSPLRQLLLEAREAIRAGYLASHLPLLSASALFAVGFTQLKSHIPELTGGFSWDASLAELDRRIHFGRHPWEWLLPIMGRPLVTFLTNVNYNLWFVLMWGMFFAFLFKPAAAPGRTRFLLAFFWVWALAGGLLAVLLSSAGPCYFALVQEGEDPFRGLMLYLREVDTVLPISALSTQDMLWARHLSGAPDQGISAMPSLHNATALLMLLASRDLHPRLRPWFAAHAVWIFLGSVHLGWHYAVDAYVAFAATALVWLAAGAFARRWDTRRASSAIANRSRDHLPFASPAFPH